MTLAEIASRDVLCLEPGMTLREASRRLWQAHATGAPVVAHGRVVGVLSMGDLAGGGGGSRVRPPEGRAVRDPVASRDEGTPDAASAEVSPPPAYYTDYWTAALVQSGPATRGGRNAESARDSEWWNGHTVAEVMARTILALPPDTDVAVAAEFMLGANVNRLLVVDEGRLVGIVTTPDMVRAMAGVRRGGSGK